MQISGEPMPIFFFLEIYELTNNAVKECTM